MKIPLHFYNSTDEFHFLNVGSIEKFLYVNGMFAIRGLNWRGRGMISKTMGCKTNNASGSFIVDTSVEVSTSSAFSKRLPLFNC